jgi:hypothetical protein
MYFRLVFRCRIFLAYPENFAVGESQSQEMCGSRRLEVGMVLGNRSVNDSSDINEHATYSSFLVRVVCHRCLT